MTDPTDPITTEDGIDTPENLSHRRRFLKAAIAFSAGAFAIAFALPAFAIKTLSLDKKSAASGDPLVYAMGDLVGQPVNTSQLTAGEGIQVYPVVRTIRTTWWSW